MANATTRSTARISLNALAEYLTATAGRRRGIIADQKRPKTFIVAYYSDAENGIVEALADGLDLSALDRAAGRIQALPASKEREAARRQSQLEAISACRAFLLGSSAKALPPLTRASQRPRPLVMNGVVISVRPELLVVDDAGQVVGGLKLYLSKNDVLTEERGRYAGAVLHYSLDQLRGPEGRVDYRRCLVLDVFSRAIHPAPRTYLRRRQDIDAACAEISALWPGA
jgi:hypothetical protein